MTDLHNPSRRGWKNQSRGGWNEICQDGTEHESSSVSLQSLLVKPDMTSARFPPVFNLAGRIKRQNLRKAPSSSKAPSAFAAAVCGKEDMVRRNQCNAYRRQRLRGAGQVSQDRQSEPLHTQPLAQKIQKWKTTKAQKRGGQILPDLQHSPISATTDLVNLKLQFKPTKLAED